MFFARTSSAAGIKLKSCSPTAVSGAKRERHSTKVDKTFFFRPFRGGEKMSVGEFFESMEANRAVLGFMMRSSSSDFINTAARRQRQLPPCSVNLSRVTVAWRRYVWRMSARRIRQPPAQLSAVIQMSIAILNYITHSLMHTASSIRFAFLSRFSFLVALSSTLQICSLAWLRRRLSPTPNPKIAFSFLYLIYSQPYLEFTFINTTIL